MGKKHYYFRYLCGVKIILFIGMFFIAYNNYSYSNDLPNCYVGIEDDKIKDKTEYIQDCNKDATGDELFLCVKNIDLENDYSVCGFKNGSLIKCEEDRINGEKCTNKFETDATSGSKIKDNCSDYENQEAKKGQIIIDNNGKDTGEVEKIPCYPENHICRRYSDNQFKGYFKKDITENGKKFFFLYKKNPKPNENCKLKIFSCDFKVKNESKIKGELNIVYSDTTDEYNKEFIDNINAGLGNMSFFKYTGFCNYNDCKNINGENILIKPYYYKYIIKNSENENDWVVSYFEKDIKVSDNNDFLCNKYLPNCIDLKPSDTPEALYTNSSSPDTNNADSVSKFYEKTLGILEKIKDEYLWYSQSSGGISARCLAVVVTIDNKETKIILDIGYCSDLNDDGTLKYPGGLKTNTEGILNCYLKSCIDLTKDELKAVIGAKGDGKYCSEYYWLSGHRGLKYFPKEKPIFCSDLEDVSGKGKQLKFRTGMYEYKECGTKKYNSDNQDINKLDADIPDVDDEGNCKEVKKTIYYSYGGGRNKNKDNCYLKNCFSLNDEERDIVSTAKFTNIGFEIDRAFALNSEANKTPDYSPSNVPVYCDNGFLFNNKFPGYEKFDYLNLNIIPCYELSSQDLSPIPFSNFLSQEHNTTNENKLCRSVYKPLNLITKKTSNECFLDSMAVVANENESTKNLKEDNISKLPPFSGSGKSMVKFSNQKIKSDFKSAYLYSNVCSYIDNNFLYYNTEIQSLKSSEFKNNHKLNSSMQEAKMKSIVYKECLDTNKERSPKNIMTDESNKLCKDKCEFDTNMDKCLYELTETDCKEYVSNDYYCKRQCSDNDEYCYIEDNLETKIIDCAKYNTSNEETPYFDCELYYNNDNDYKNNILKSFKFSADGDKIETIQKACESMLPPKETRNLVEPNILYKLVKPDKVDIKNHKLNSTGRPRKYDIERYGCAKYDKPDFRYGLYGCKLPSFSSSYISTVLTGEMADGEEKPSNFLPKSASNSGINVCSRYPNSIYDNKCGQREGSKYNDNACITLTEENKIVNLEDPESNSWVFSESTGATRFRMAKSNRDIFVFRDFHTYHYCYSDFKKEFIDGDSFGLIFGEGVLLYTIPSTVGCISGCTSAGPFFPLCVGICIPVSISAFSALFATARMSEWKINLQNDLHIPRGYITSTMFPVEENKIYVNDYYMNDYYDKGMITKALLTNNDNYVYRFYPRSSNIETDIKNKLESNIKGGNRFFYETTLGVDIIKKCKLSNLLTNSTEPSKCSNHNDCDYDYKFNELKKDGKIKGVCNSKRIKDCLDPALVSCVESYGVRFFDEDTDFNDIEIDLTLRNGGFLKKFKNGDIKKDSWGTSSNENTRIWVPVDIVYYTKDTQTEEQLKDNDNCKMGIYGDPIGDLARCRGFKIDCEDSSDAKLCSFLIEENPKFKKYKAFHTESQSVKVPLFGSPFFFYTLITPRNTPELFDPSFFLKSFYHFHNNDIKVMFSSNKDVIVDFFNPKFVFEYDFNGGSSSSSYRNVYENENNYVSQINVDSLYSPPYILKYKGDLISEREYNYTLQKSYTTGIYGEYIPEIRVYRIKAVNNKDDSNSILELASCESQNQIRCAEGKNFMSVDNNVATYKRAPIDFKNFTLKQLSKEQIKNGGFTGPYFKNPRIQVYIGSEINEYPYKKSNRGKIYLLTQGEDKYIKDFGKSDIQGYGVNLTRSYCSKLYYDYYEYLDILEREKKGKNDLNEINRLNKIISSIDSTIRKDCDEENGEETEVLINESKMSTQKDIDNNKSKKIVTKETVIVKKYNESYGGFNEVCISDYDIEKIFELRKEYKYNLYLNMPRVLAFKDGSNRQRKTKCVLNLESRRNKKCLIADKVYVYCDTEDKRLSSDKCMEYLDLNSLKKVWITTFNCYDYNLDKVNPILTKDLNSITDIGFEMLKACFKGGFNYFGNVQKNLDNNSDKEITDFVDPCLCTEVNPNNKTKEDASKQNIDEKKYTIRDMTPREYGLCVDLEKPSICPAVRYYDINKEYIDDNLALNKTKEDLDEEGHQNYYEQHLWRTEEKQFGIIPSVFYTKTLGHAEFPASIYCSDYEEDCIGGSKLITGECRGYWKQNGDKVPKAICTKKELKDGRILYEYKLNSDSECIRYSCPKIGYDSKNNEILDEKDIENKSSNIILISEAKDFLKINRTDYTSFTNNEETSREYVDKRGAFNGFAIWKGKEISKNDYNFENLEDKYSSNKSKSSNNLPKDQRSGDFAIKLQASECLTGFAPAGTNEQVYYNYGENQKDQQDKYDNVHEKDNDFIKNLMDITKVYKDQHKFLTENNKTNLPVRLCNQKGEWQASVDVYNLLLIDKDNQNNNFYYNKPENYWFKNLWSENSGIEKNVLIDNPKYCERLVCKELYPNNENIYLTEFINSGVLQNLTWRQNGGAYWSATSSPRNSSNLVTYNGETKLTPDKSSTDIIKIYTKKSNGDYVENKYKYVKKVKGICQNKYGYYDRNTLFNGDFTKQVEEIRNRTNKNKNLISFEEIRQKDEINGSIDWYIIDKQKSVFPYRMCTSTGLWGGITDRCFRACEMLDIFQTSIDEKLYKNRANLQDNLFVENHDIKALNITKIDEISNNKKEERFKIMNLREGPDKANINNVKTGFRYGDFLTGGAQWPRSIVTVDSETEKDEENLKKGMRYIEVTGKCDKTYESDDETILTQYVAFGEDFSKKDGNGNKSNEVIIYPTRKCYEDGTWGPVSFSTRCVLAKSCTPFELRVVDLAKLIKEYNKSEGSDLLSLNELLSEMYRTRKKINREIRNNKDAKKCKDSVSKCNRNCDNLESVSGANESCLCCGEDKPKGEYDTCKCCGSNSNLLNDKEYQGSLDKEDYYNSCRVITKLDAENAKVIKATSDEKIFQYNDKKGFQNEIYSDRGYEKIDIGAYAMICNSSAPEGDYVTGWSFKKLSLENYFIPRTCQFKLVQDRFLEEAIDSKIDKPSSVSMGHLNRIVFLRKTDKELCVEDTKSTDNKNNCSLLHYTKESLLQTVYNELNRGSNQKYTERLYKNTSKVVDDSYKSISIGNKDYLSYQLNAICDNRYFYNKIEGANYYNKNIVFECSGETCINNNNCKFMYHKSTNSDNLIKTDACLPKTCGKNIYQPSWSVSYVKEVINGDYSFTGTKKSSLNCTGARRELDASGKEIGDAIESAFVVTNSGNNLGSGTLNDYKSYLSSYGFASAINVECSAYKSKEYYLSNPSADPKNIPMNINDKTAENTYDANRYGDLLFKNMTASNNIQFCKDVARTDCQKITEDSLANGTKFREDYCVKMVCPKTGLKLVDSEDGKYVKIETENPKPDPKPDTFSLPGKEGDYTFGKVVVIQSLAGDFNYNISRKNGNSPNPNFKYVQYGNVGNDDGQILGNICPTDQDIYNKGIASPYSYFDHIEAVSSKAIEIEKCFNKLENKNAIIACNEGHDGYEFLGNGTGTCVLYSKNKKDPNAVVDNIENAISNYKPDETKLKNEVANFIIDKLFEPILNGSFGDVKLQGYIDTNIIQVAEEYAKDEATKKFNESSETFCFYNDKSADFDESKLTEIKSTEPDKTKYNNINFFKYIDERIFSSIPDNIGEKCPEKKVKGVSVTCSKGSEQTKTSCLPLGKKENGHCDSGYESKVVECGISIEGKKYQLKEVFDAAYELAYNNKFKELKEEFKKALASNNSPTEFKKLFDKYYKIFKMNDFLINVKEEKEENGEKIITYKNIDYYNDFLSNAAAINGQVYFDVFGIVYSDISNSYSCGDSCDEVDPDTIKTTVNIIKFDPVNVFTNDMIPNCSSAEDANTNKKNCPSIVPDEKTKNEYNKFFINFLLEKTSLSGTCSESNCNARDFGTIYKNKIKNENDSCNEIYKEFISLKTIADNNKKEGISLKTMADNNKKESVFSSGLFMVMKCTPEGWEVIDRPKCVKRCNGSKIVKIDPNGKGSYNVKVTVSNLRHTKNTDRIEMGAHRSQAACSAGNMHAFRYDGVSFSCKDGNMSISEQMDAGGGGKTDSFQYHSNGLVWKIYCSGTFSAFGQTTQRNADTDGTVSFPYADSFCWRDHYYTKLGILCPEDKNIKFFESSRTHKCGTKFDTITEIEYDVKKN